MSDIPPGLFLANFILGGIVGMAFSFAVLLNANDNSWQRKIVERGHAQYCPTTGEWAWKGECDE